MKDVDRIQIRKVYPSCPGWPSGRELKRVLQSDKNICYPLQTSAPHKYMKICRARPRLVFTFDNGFSALGGQYHSLSGTEFSASKRVTCLLPTTQVESHAGSNVYIWNVFGPDRPPARCVWTEGGGLLGGGVWRRAGHGLVPPAYKNRQRLISLKKKRRKNVCERMVKF